MKTEKKATKEGQRDARTDFDNMSRASIKSTTSVKGVLKKSDT